jgi:hypothetical protein
MRVDSLKKSLLFLFVFVITLTGNAQSHFERKIQYYLDSIRMTYNLPGITVSFSRGEVSPVNLLPVKARMPAGSIGKTFFAVLTVMLEEKGQLSLDDRFRNLLVHAPGSTNCQMQMN